MAKYLPAVWEAWAQPVGREDPLEKGMATHSSTLAWRIPGTEKPGRLQSMGLSSLTRLSDYHSSLCLYSLKLNLSSAGQKVDLVN